MLTLAAVINGDLSALRADKPSPIVIPKRAAIPRQTRQPRARANANGFQNPSAAAPQACYQPNGSDYAVATVPPQPQDTAVTPPPVAMPAIPETVPAESPGKSDPVAACVMRIANLVRYPNSTKLTTECDWLMKTIKEGKRAERKNAQRTAVDSGIVQHLANVAGSYYGYGADAKALALRTLAAVCFSNSRNRKYLADNGVIELARTFINRHSPNPDHGVRRNALALLNNIAGSRESHEKILAYYGADEIIARVEDTEEDDVAQQAIALLRNLAFNEKMRDVLLRAGTVPALALAIKRFHLDPDTFAAMDITMAIACLVGHEESNPYLHADERTLKRIVKSFHETLNDTEAKKSYVIWKLCMSLSKLAVSEHNKVILGQIGAIECLQAALDWKVPEGADDCVLRRTEYALTGLWNLAFHEQNRLKINENIKLVRTIRMLDQKTTERIIHEKCAGLLFTLGCFSESPDGTCSVRVTPKDASTKGHVMLSYCWAEQELVVRISKRLKEAGFTVWLDIENMSGDTLEAMANAVEGASVVVVAMSSSYKESANCRMEAEYAIQRRRRIVPLLVEEGYSPDGWLGIMLGTKLFIDFSQSEYFEQKLRALQSELGTVGATGNPTAAAATTPKSPTNPLAQSQSHGSDSTVLIELQAVRAENVAMRQEIRELKEMMHRLVTNLGM